MDKFHVYIQHLVLEVWCKAEQPFVSSMLPPEFEELVLAMPPTYMLNPIIEIYNDLISKPTDFKSLLEKGFRNNNSIEALCNGSVEAVHYAAIKASDKTLSNRLYQFFVRAYELLDDTRVKAKLGGIKAHYDQFFSQGTNITVCPFCGLSPMLNSFNSKREAYDHFFPKETYPFNSVNFENLLPMCHTCNSKYKSRKDPINLKYGGTRKKVFYSFSKNPHPAISITLSFSTDDVAQLRPQDVQVHIASDDMERTERWKDIFGIEERYKAVCCDITNSNAWLEEYRLTQQSRPIPFDNYVQIRAASPYTNRRFLEIAYLQACHSRGIIN